jgi:hypothetical protein
MKDGSDASWTIQTYAICEFGAVSWGNITLNNHSDLRAALDRKFGPAKSASAEVLPHVAVCVPAMDHIHTTFFTDFLQLMVHSATFCAAFHPIVVRDTILQRSRSILAGHALKHAETTHVLFIDSDMRFPSYALKMLIDADKDIIGANYRHRSDVVDSVARSDDDEKVFSAGRTGLQSVLHTGTGFLLIKRAVFEKIEKPWFETTYRHKQDDWLGEDVYFCIRARQAGFQVFIDHDLSREIGHTGTTEYRWE